MCMVIQIAIFLDTIKRTKYRNIFCQTNQTRTLSTRVHYIYISDVKMASPLSEKVQLCPHCNKFLSSRTVLRHRKLYGKSKRRAWRPALHVPSIGAHSLPLADQTDEEFVDMAAASREIPEDTVMMDEASGLEDDQETELDTSGCSDDDEDGQAAQHWDEAEEELERDITSRDQRKQHNSLD
eukprot:XP_011430822.1 PREDICTED: uncharacterized protein LOC105330664 [Crassostrea gigas]